LLFSLSTKERSILSFSSASFLSVITSDRRFPRAIWQLSSSAFFCALKALLRIKPYKKIKDQHTIIRKDTKKVIC
jgi:mevalonate pyrophosphate decarboxylase